MADKDVFAVRFSKNINYTFYFNYQCTNEEKVTIIIIILTFQPSLAAIIWMCSNCLLYSLSIAEQSDSSAQSEAEEQCVSVVSDSASF